MCDGLERNGLDVLHGLIVHDGFSFLSCSLRGLVVGGGFDEVEVKFVDGFAVGVCRADEFVVRAEDFVVPVDVVDLVAVFECDAGHFVLLSVSGV